MKRILFVDDEQQVLDGLRNTLFRQRKVWEMTFANSGRAALELLQLGTYDVIVSDMRMPGMSGAELLQQVRASYPGMARLILSGQSTAAELAVALPVMHQFLAKPCDPVDLRDTIDCVCRVQRLLHNDVLQQLAGRVERLPGSPLLASTLQETLGCAEVSKAQVVQAIEQDVALSAKVLQLANSSYFGLSHRVHSVEKAVQQMGIATIQSLVLTARLYSAIPPELARLKAYSSLTHRALLRYRLVRAISTRSQSSDIAATSAMLLDVGQMVFGQISAVKFAKVLRAASRSQAAMANAERKAFGATHAALGAYVLGLWGLPCLITDIVARHLDPVVNDEAEVMPLASVHFAHCAVEAAYRGSGDFLSGMAPTIIARPEVAVLLDAWQRTAETVLAASPIGQSLAAEKLSA